MLIAIDGPAGAGKSSVARATARQLGFTYLDSGAMYRCVALALRERGGDAAELASSLNIELSPAPGDPAAPVVILDGRDVSQAIRSPEVSEAASRVAAQAPVRQALVAKQRELVARGDWVAEGRDIGTVVAPNAAVKVFLTASEQERAHRRAAEQGSDLQRVLEDLRARDERDRTREHSPLVAAPDAVTLDTTGLDLNQVVGRIVSLARAAAPEGQGS